MRSSRFDLRRLGAIYAGGVIGALARVGLAEAAAHGPGEWPWATFAVNTLVWLNLGLSLVAGFAAVALGHWVGGML
jgi:fluoride ion exporter CrcB/FEX